VALTTNNNIIVTYQNGHPLLKVDFSNLEEDFSIFQLIMKTHQFISSFESEHLLIYINLSNKELSLNTKATIRKLSQLNSKHVYKTAIVGLKSGQKIEDRIINKMINSKIHIFQSEAEAFDYLLG
jgi:hypothetical protein